MELAYFDNIKHVILKELDQARKTIKIAVAWFTNQELFDKILEKRAKGIKVELILVDDSINNGVYGLDFQKLLISGGLIRYSHVEKPIHHKFCIIDDNTLINGSYNWTYYAENRNLENIIVIKNNENLIKEYINQYLKLSTSLTKVRTIVKKQNNTLHSTAINEYIAYDLYFKGKELNNLSSLEAATRLLPSNKVLAATYKTMTSAKINKVLTTSLGIKSELNGVAGSFSVLAEKGKTIPFSNSGTYLTTEDGQKSILIQTYKGAHRLTRYNKRIGEFEISGLPTKPAGQATVTVTFEIDEIGKLTVSAKNDATGDHVSASYEVSDLVF